MEEFKIKRADAACAACARAFASGERIISTIREIEEQFVRADTCVECRPQEDVFCFFHTTAPVVERSEKTIKEEVTEFFRRLEAQADRSVHQQRLMYLSGLWLSRKKALKLTASRREGGRGILVLQKAWDGEALDLPEEIIPDEALPPLMEELGALFHLPVEETKKQLHPPDESV